MMHKGYIGEPTTSSRIAPRADIIAFGVSRNLAMTTEHTDLSIEEYLRERLMPVEGSIPHISGIEMYGNSIPVGTVGGDLFEYINFRQRYDIGARIQRALRLSKEFLEE